MQVIVYLVFQVIVFFCVYSSDSLFGLSNDGIFRVYSSDSLFGFSIDSIFPCLFK